MTPSRTGSADTTSAAFFEEKYRSSDDPWNFAGDTYENARYRRILQALDGQRFLSAFEPGCSVGVLTRMLAGIADSVEACDFSETAVAAARVRCADAPNVCITCRSLTADEPWPRFDLVVLSEIGYYFIPESWDALVHRMCSELPAGALLAACHWLGHSPDHVQDGDDVHEALAAQPQLQHRQGERHAPGTAPDGRTHGYRLDLWRRV